MTARGDRDKEAFLHAGFTDYIYKPFSSSELLGLLSRMKTDRREKNRRLISVWSFQRSMTSTRHCFLLYPNQRKTEKNLMLP